MILKLQQKTKTNKAIWDILKATYQEKRLHKQISSKQHFHLSSSQVFFSHSPHSLFLLLTIASKLTTVPYF